MGRRSAALVDRLEQKTDPAPVRCAIYTRKSTSVRLDQDFNSLDAQRSACEGYIDQRAGLGWRTTGEAYEDESFLRRIVCKQQFDL